MSATSGAVIPRYSFGDELGQQCHPRHRHRAQHRRAGYAGGLCGTACSNALAVTACAVFGTSLVLLYTASTLYHSISVAAAKPALRALDHIAIYVLIAGTYTPFTLIALPGPWGWSLFAAVWTLALAGSALELGLLKRYHKLAVLLYVGMGWIGMIAFKPLSEHLQTGGMLLLIGGGVAYTLGVPFYLWRRLPYHHALWHVFVLAGSVLHFLAVLLYVIPDAAA